MKFPPASRKASKILRLSSFDAPHPSSSPKVMAPRQSSETRRPNRPDEHATPVPENHEAGEGNFPPASVAAGPEQPLPLEHVGKGGVPSGNGLAAPPTRLPTHTPKPGGRVDIR